MQIVDKRDQVPAPFAILSQHGCRIRIDGHLKPPELIDVVGLHLVPGEEDAVPVRRPFAAVQHLTYRTSRFGRRNNFIQRPVGALAARRHQRRIQPLIDSLVEDEEAASETHQYEQSASEQSDVEVKLEPEFSQLETVLRWCRWT